MAERPHSRARAAARLATADDVPTIARLLHDFNTEFGDPTPGPDALAVRIRLLLARGETDVLVVGSPPEGLSVLRFRDGIWDEALECYLAELYVARASRGKRLGRVLLEGSLAHARVRGASRIELGTGASDTVARTLYESLGFDNRERDGSLILWYEREL